MKIGTSLESFEQAIHSIERQVTDMTDSEQKELLENSCEFLKRKFAIQLIKEQVARATEIDDIRESLMSLNQDITQKMKFSFPEFENGSFIEPKPKMGMTKKEFQTLRDQLWEEFTEREAKRQSRYEKQKAQQQKKFEDSSGYRKGKETQDKINQFLPQLEPSWIEAQIQRELSVDDSSEDLYQQILKTCADRMVIEEEDAFVSEKVNHKPLFSISKENKIELDMDVYLDFLEAVHTIYLNVKREQENRDRQQKIGDLEKEQETLLSDRCKLEAKQEELKETYQRVLNKHTEDRLFQAFVGESATLPSHEGLKELMEGYLDQLDKDKETVTTYRRLLKSLEKEKRKPFFKQKKIKIEEAKRQVEIFENDHGGVEVLEQKPFNMVMSCMRIASLHEREDRDQLATLFHERKICKEDIWKKIDSEDLGDPRRYVQFLGELESVFTGTQENYELFLEGIHDSQNRVIKNYAWLEEQIGILKECSQNYKLNRKQVEHEFQRYQSLNEEVMTELAEIDCKLEGTRLQIAQLKSEDTPIVSEEGIVSEEDRKRFLERYCVDDSENNLSLEFVTLEATVKAQNEMLQVQDFHSDFANHTKKMVTTTINTLKQEMPTAISKGTIPYQKTL